MLDALLKSEATKIDAMDIGTPDRPAKTMTAKTSAPIAAIRKAPDEVPGTHEGLNNKKKSKKVGSARGIESMFRTSYQAQLDMIALAATKANIMISLNGVLVSVLLISGAYFLNSEPMLIVPFASFLLTCTVAIVFAVLAAQPVKNGKKTTLDDFRSDRGDLLIFEQFAQLPKAQYVDAMMEMLRDNDRVYRCMIVHIHAMGQAANRKFAHLNVSYGAFMIGLVTSVLLLLVVIARHMLAAG